MIGAFPQLRILFSRQVCYDDIDFVFVLTTQTFKPAAQADGLSSERAPQSPQSGRLRACIAYMYVEEAFPC
ncbi:hypothetical protein TAMA11512_00330 [Selenomonas sp. TAMA-11512]|uniref:hypothetical protein n=1 Tax=Selenomonas sp. TAMA-11512 TaxID=3095337 RepID=UPI00308AD691|nr:hypothetical protein TAMA11512_00330 [Selenomonas sp. TAMA-11512]